MVDGTELRDRNLATAFAFLDAGGDGYLSRDDLLTLAERVCKRFALDAGEHRTAIMDAVHNWWRQLEQDCTSRDGRISKADFSAAMVSGRGDPLDYFRKGLGAISVVMARAIDRDGDGLIGLEEYESWFSAVALSREVVVAAFERLDTDGDGYITHEEFIDGTQQLMLSQDMRDPGTAMLGQV